jgi:hypothetical protein
LDKCTTSHDGRWQRRRILGDRHRPLPRRGPHLRHVMGDDMILTARILGLRKEVIATETS